MWVRRWRFRGTSATSSTVQWEMRGNVMVACDDGGGEGVGEGATDIAERFPAEEEECEEDVETDEGARENVTLVVVDVFVCNGIVNGVF